MHGVNLAIVSRPANDSNLPTLAAVADRPSRQASDGSRRHKCRVQRRISAAQVPILVAPRGFKICTALSKSNDRRATRLAAEEGPRTARGKLLEKAVEAKGLLRVSLPPSMSRFQSLHLRLLCLGEEKLFQASSPAPAHCLARSSQAPSPRRQPNPP